MFIKTAWKGGFLVDMALPTSYLITTKNLDDFFNTLISAQAPERFSQKFLQDLDFKSTNDRLYIGILKNLGMLDENSNPTDRYYMFLDQTQSKRVLAEAIKEAYADLFAVNVSAQNMTVEEVKNKLKTLTQGQKTDRVLGLMANTFKGLSDYAEWKPPVKEGVEISEEKKEKQTSSAKQPIKTHDGDKPEFHYNIQIHLPATRDSTIYDALFKSLKDHLL